MNEKKQLDKTPVPEKKPPGKPAQDERIRKIDEQPRPDRSSKISDTFSPPPPKKR